jgi:hypothetical protein
MTPFVPLMSVGTGRMVGGYLASDRGVRLTVTTPGGNIAAGESVELGGIYRLADPSTAN